MCSFSVPLFFFSLNYLQSPSNNCHTGSNDISNSHSRIPACTAEDFEDFFGQGTGQSPKDIGSTFFSSSEDLPDEINIFKDLGQESTKNEQLLIFEIKACFDRS